MVAFSVTWFYTQSIGLLGREISSSKCRFLHTGQHKIRINTSRYPCFQWDSSPRPQCPSGWKQFIP
jgi:hypothetical protein